MGGKKPLRRPLWPPTRATASNYYPLGLDGAGGAAKPLLRAPKKPAPLHGRLPAFSGAVDAFERARKCFLEWRYFFSIILSEFLKNRVALHSRTQNEGCFLLLVYSGRRKKASGKEDAPGTADKGTKVRLPDRETHSAFRKLFSGTDVSGSDRGVRGGGSPPRMRSHPPQPLYVKGCGEQSEDFSAPERAEK